MKDYLVPLYDRGWFVGFEEKPVLKKSLRFRKDRDALDVLRKFGEWCAEANVRLRNHLFFYLLVITLRSELYLLTVLLLLLETNEQHHPEVIWSHTWLRISTSTHDAIKPDATSNWKTQGLTALDIRLAYSLESTYSSYCTSSGMVPKPSLKPKLERPESGAELERLNQQVRRSHNPFDETGFPSYLYDAAWVVWVLTLNVLVFWALFRFI